MVWMKNLAKARAPAAVCRVARSGSTGGRSSAERRFGPLVGTSAGTVGRAGGCDSGGELDTGGVGSGADREVGAFEEWLASVGRRPGGSVSVQPAARAAASRTPTIPRNPRMPGIMALIVPVDRRSRADCG